MRILKTRPQHERFFVGLGLVNGGQGAIGDPRRSVLFRRQIPRPKVIVVVDIEMLFQVHTLAAQPSTVVHAGSVRFGGVADYKFGAVEAEVGSVPLVKVIEVMHRRRRLRTGRILTRLKVRLA